MNELIFNRGYIWHRCTIFDEKVMLWTHDEDETKIACLHCGEEWSKPNFFLVMRRFKRVRHQMYR